ncbi:MAG: response regulator, partial [Candidatus Thiodiazotropha endolucinida]
MRRKVLIVEDEPDIAHLVQTHLNDIGCDADIAGNGAAAMNLFNKGGYHLVVLDLMLPDTDGLTLCRNMRAAGESPRLFKDQLVVPPFQFYWLTDERPDV